MFLVATVHVELTNALYRQFLLLELNLVGTRSELVGKVPHVVRERSGEEDDLRGLCPRQETSQISYQYIENDRVARLLFHFQRLIPKTILVEHVISFIKHKNFDA